MSLKKAIAIATTIVNKLRAELESDPVFDCGEYVDEYADQIYTGDTAALTGYLQDISPELIKLYE